MRGLEFGDQVEDPRYRPVPALDRRGAYAEPFVHYYYDPYYDYMNWVMLSAMWSHHSWASPQAGRCR